MVLSTREKLLVALLGVLVVVIGLYLGVGSLSGRLADLRGRVAVRQALLQKATALRAEMQRLSKAGTVTRSPRAGSLIGYVEQLSQRVGVRDRIQLNAIPRDTESGLQGLEVKVNNLSLDETVNLLYTLEDADYRLVIDQLELSPSFRDKDLLRLSMRVLTRE